MNYLTRRNVIAGFLMFGVGFFILQSLDAPIPQDPQVAAVTSATPVGKSIIGNSVEGRPIESYVYGTGEKHLLFVGGIHGGYEWNSVLLAYAMIDHFALSSTTLPSDVTIMIIPSLNPDAVAKVVGKNGRFIKTDALSSTVDPATARFNAHAVDLNRNFDCKWQPESTWRSKVVSAGSSAFSEPEAQALRDYVALSNPVAVTFWHSQANAVYASECTEGVLPETLDVMNIYGDAANYKKVASFDAYPVTGDAEGWLASIGIPAITVELKTHEVIEFAKNLKGVNALIEMYATQVPNQLQ